MPRSMSKVLGATSGCRRMDMVGLGGDGAGGSGGVEDCVRMCGVEALVESTVAKSLSVRVK